MGDMLPDRDTEGSLSPLQRLFVSRLGRMLRLRSEQAGQLNEEGVRLIDRAIYSTYCDGVDLGAAEEAQNLLHKHAVPAGHDQNPS
jgi:hypothetical protein